MLIKPLMFVTIPSLILGTLIACSSSSWLVIWMGLEINLMSFIPLLINKLSQPNSENAIKYFLIQAMASVLIISMVSMNSMEINYAISNHSINIIMVSLALKAGIAPVHFWFPQIIEGLNWLQASVMLTWQKIAPMIIISYNFTSLMPLLVVSSALLGAILGLNQVSVKKIMAFSSIMNAAWLIMASFLSINMWWVYFIIYSTIIISIIFSWNKIINNNINSSIMLEMNLIVLMLIFLNVLSLAGLPPFAGFFIKIMIIESMMSYDMMWIMLVMLISSAIAFYYYMRMMYSMLFFNNKKTPLFLLNFNYKSIFIKVMIIISVFLNLSAMLMCLII